MNEIKMTNGITHHEGIPYIIEFDAHGTGVSQSVIFKDLRQMKTFLGCDVEDVNIDHTMEINDLYDSETNNDILYDSTNDENVDHNSDEKIIITIDLQKETVKNFRKKLVELFKPTIDKYGIDKLPKSHKRSIINYKILNEMIEYDKIRDKSNPYKPSAFEQKLDEALKKLNIKY